jgi:hypothetical protein
MKLNILVLGSGGNASRNYVSSLKLDQETINKVIGIDINPNAKYFSNTDEVHILNSAEKSEKIDFINSIIKSENIDYIHAQPDQEVKFLANNRNFLNCKSLSYDIDSLLNFQDKEISNKIWSKLFNTVQTYTYLEIKKNNQLFEKLLLATGKAWIRKSIGAGSSGALPITSFQDAENWVNYWKINKNALESDFIISEFLPGKEFAVQIMFWEGELVHLQARERVEYFFANQMVSGQSSTPSISRTITNPNVEKTSLKSVLEIQETPHGIYCVDLKENSKGEVIPMEVNYGRFFTTTYFFSQLNVNTPLDIIKKSFDIPVEKKINFLPENIFCYRGLDMPMKIVDKSKL